MDKPALAPCTSEALSAASALQSGFFHQLPQSPQHMRFNRVYFAAAFAEDKAELLVSLAVGLKPLDEVVVSATSRSSLSLT
jgi:hypothetical protein